MLKLRYIAPTVCLTALLNLPSANLALAQTPQSCEALITAIELARDAGVPETPAVIAARGQGCDLTGIVDDALDEVIVTPQGNLAQDTEEAGEQTVAPDVQEVPEDTPEVASPEDVLVGAPEVTTSADSTTSEATAPPDPDVETLRNEITALRQALTDTEQSRAALQRALDKAREDERAEEALRDALAASEVEIATLQETIEQQQAEIVYLQSQQIGAVGMKEELDALRAKMAEQEEVLDANDETITRLGDARRKLEEEIDQMALLNDALEKDLNGARTRLKATQDQVTALMQKSAEIAIARAGPLGCEPLQLETKVLPGFGDGVRASTTVTGRVFGPQEHDRLRAQLDATGLEVTYNVAEGHGRKDCPLPGDGFETFGDLDDIRLFSSDEAASFRESLPKLSRSKSQSPCGRLAGLIEQDPIFAQYRADTPAHLRGVWAVWGDVLGTCESRASGYIQVFAPDLSRSYPVIFLAQE